ncbi:MAG: hypothetical protein KBF76_19395 [Verrucomicrobiales bacterium]|nr:hypothetical protein [Verrucomicrobiales bacterium]
MSTNEHESDPQRAGRLNTTSEYDAKTLQLISQADNSQTATRYSYKADGRLAKVTDGIRWGTTN